MVIESPEMELLRWSKRLSDSDATDPLGLNLRVSARLDNQLLFCITSATPRARYYSFLVWCIYDYQYSEMGTPRDRGLIEGVRMRATALTLGCVAHHDGHPCDRGGLVGSNKAIVLLSPLDLESSIALSGIRLTENTAFDAYYASLLQLGMFKTEEDYLQDGVPHPKAFNELELSPLGERVAESLHSSLSGFHLGLLDAFPLRRIREFGSLVGLCELVLEGSPDLELLRQVFLDKVQSPNQSHKHRRGTLLAILALTRQLGALQQDDRAFRQSAFYGSVETVATTWPTALADVRCRWQVYYFHFYFSVALERLFSWVVVELQRISPAGLTVEDLHQRFSTYTAADELEESLGWRSDGIAELNPMQLSEAIAAAGVSMPEERLVDSLVRADTSAATPILSICLLLIVAFRYEQFRGEETNQRYSAWFDNNVLDPELDMSLPVAIRDLAQNYDDWLETPSADLFPRVLSRFVLQQHEMLAYEKSHSGGRSILQRDGMRVFATGNYDGISAGNVRYSSALKILQDLRFLEALDSGNLSLTPDGEFCLRTELGF